MCLRSLRGIAFRPRRPPREVLGQNFSDYIFLVPGEVVCQGCRSLLGGKPGENPPPLRTVPVVARDDAIDYPDATGFWKTLRDPRRVRVISWPTSRKRHHWLRAGLSDDTRLLIGTDNGCVEYKASEHKALLDAVEELLRGPGGAPIFPRSAITSGQYHPASIRKFGAERWRRLESIVSRYRPSLLLDLVVTVAPVSEAKDDNKEDVMLTLEEETAITILTRLAKASLYRRRYGQDFWKGFFRHRVERFKHFDLETMVSRLMDDLACPPTDPASLLVAREVAKMDDEKRAGVAKAIRDRAGLLVALTYDRIKEV